MSSIRAQIRDAVAGLRPSKPEGGWLRLPEGRPSDETVKPVPYLPIYEQLLHELRGRSFTLLELGVWKGHSLEMWRDAFPLATIVGVDLRPPELDLGTRVHIVEGDQTDPALMRRLRESLAPGGFEVIIDDASHFGTVTARSLQALYSEHLCPGGLYCIEDWGTGYMLNWEDGGRIEEPLQAANLDNVSAVDGQDVEPPISMPSHSLGMVGLVKRLVDHTARNTARWAQPERVGDALEIETMHVWDGIVALRKPAT
ncbi:MAG: hypothetical protein ACLQBB_03575 [Solirubrobacteraceae bacterium]